MDNYNAYEKYITVRVFGYLQDEYRKIFNNGRWPAIIDIYVPEGNTYPVQEIYKNGDHTNADGCKCYKRGGNNIFLTVLDYKIPILEVILDA